jgi:ElaB/YqjD/DUF883 family membrane-anchored ribosome-binding protein
MQNRKIPMSGMNPANMNPAKRFEQRIPEVFMNEISSEKLLADVALLIADTEELIKATAGQAGERIAELRQRLERKIVEGRAALLECERELRQQAEQAKACVIKFSLEESWPRLVVAAALGMLLGLAVRRIH